MSIALTKQPDTSPQTTLDAVLAIFERILGADLVRAPLQPEDDFFDLGGDSALAAAILLDIENRFGVTLPVNLLFDAPTPAAIAAAIDGAGAPHGSFCVLLKAATVLEPGRPGLFIIPGVHGIAQPLGPLARQIDVPNPVHGLQPPGLDGHTAPLDRVEALAAHYLAAIRAVQPAGPYGLIGYSMGGLIALEMACILAAAGEPPALLVLLDTMIPHRHWPLGALLRVWSRRLRHHAALLRGQTLRQLIPYIFGRFRAAMREAGAAPGDISAHLAGPMRPVYRAGRRAAEHYRPRRYPGKAGFVEASAGWWPTYPDILWRRLAGTLTIRAVPGNHMEMIRSGAVAVGAVLTEFARHAHPGFTGKG